MYFIYVFFNFMHSGILSACRSVHHVCALCRRSLEEDIRSTGVTGGCEVPCGFLGIKPGSSERPARATEPSLQPLCILCLYVCFETGSYSVAQAGLELSH